jgi:porin
MSYVAFIAPPDEVFGNPNGGRAQGATFFGQTALGLGIDLDKAIDLKVGIFNVSAYQTYGHGISAAKIDNLSLVSNIEATRSARLFEALVSAGPVWRRG